MSGIMLPALYLLCFLGFFQLTLKKVLAYSAALLWGFLEHFVLTGMDIRQS
jgi:hypothetical protein